MDAFPPSPCLLTIAGFDPSSGAGITADQAVFAAHRCFGISCITALTVQSTLGVRRVQPVDAALLTETLNCLEEDLPPAGIKVGVLSGKPQVRSVAEYLQRLAKQGRKPHVVLDPVLRSSSGTDLLTDDGLVLLLEELLPLAGVVTPNTVELALLTGQTCETAEQIADAAATLSARYTDLAVLVTGGHCAEPDDVLFQAGCFTILKGTRVETLATHGTGCAFSSALLCGLVAGKSMADAAAEAKHYVEIAMRLAVPRGSGKGPMHLLWPLLGQ